MTALRAVDLGVTVKGAVLLDGVNLSVDQGEWLSIIGPNGAGKSTLLRALAGKHPSRGSVTVLDDATADLSARERARRISWVPQTPVIPPGMTVLDYVLLGRTPHLHPLAGFRSSDIASVESIIDELDLTPFTRRTVETLSGGERQRAVIARALAQEAPVLLLDEPTTALDLGHQQDVLRLLDRLRLDGDRTIITTMHDLTLAGQFADRLVLLAGGSIVSEGSAQTVLTEANISKHYRADVEISHRGHSVLVVPRINPSDSHPTEE